MTQAFTTRQFQAGNSQAVRLPADLAFPPKTELVVTRVGEKIIVQPLEKTMEHVPRLFAALKKHVVSGHSSDQSSGQINDQKSEQISDQFSGPMRRPDFVEAARNRRKK